MYRIEATKIFDEDLAKLDHRVASFILSKIEWLATHPEAARFPLMHLPKSLKGLQKYRVGDYRILFYINHRDEVIVLYRVIHRSEVYRNLY